ncbi:MAG: hypothetical protein HQL49_10710 [Gammaproteobacteria bacterium]|nr:hypothetical protein [Gammaproteobacteria bacterium]
MLRDNKWFVYQRRGSFALLLLLIACSGVGSRPDWIDNPQGGAVGSCGTHVEGYHAQKQLAIARAIEELAIRNGVSVSSLQLINENVANDRSSITASRESSFRVTDSLVKVKLEAHWYDRARDTLWVWLRPVK